MRPKARIAKPWFSDLDTFALSPEPPSSGQTVDWSTFAGCVRAAKSAGNILIKIEIFDDAGHAWARAAADKSPELPLYLHPGNLQVDPEVAVDPQRLADKLLWFVDEAIGNSWFTP